LDISKEWKPKERLELVAKLAEKIRQLQSRRHPYDHRLAFNLADAIVEVASRPADQLENRKSIILKYLNG